MMRVLILAELGLGLVALLWARFSSTTVQYSIDSSVVLTSIGLTIPFAALNFAVFALGRRFRIAKRVYELFEGELFPLIQKAAAWELLAAAAVAGLAEELLFRGLLQPWIGLVPASLIFGLAHGPTFDLIAFSAWATSAGLLFGVLYEWTGNLAHPVLVHAFYDAFALLYVKYAWSAPPRGQAGAERVRQEEVSTSLRAEGLEYAKAEAQGNDFLLVRERDASELRLSAPGLARAICDRHRGLGADGLILFDAPAADPSVRMRLLNSDGSSAEISGNGLRCLAALLVHRRLVTSFPLHIDTEVGRRSLERVSSPNDEPQRREGRFRFRADMGVPEAFEESSLETEGVRLVGTSLSLGNPHFVIFGDADDASELRRIGPRVATHERFSNGTNVEIVQVLDRSRLRVAFWERGAGETLSSGTGSSAAAAAALRKGLVDSPVVVECVGGSSLVDWAASPESALFLTGDATVVSEGRYFYRDEPSS